ncbi:syntaxin-17-like [Babylonia areolata]|uniref:syntaxin-17-like n=1 Tax=Babylonia areolata TaxID=304850 RepID=UPI003FD42052
MTSTVVAPSSFTSETHQVVAPEIRQVGGNTMTKGIKLPLQRLQLAINKYLKVLDNHLHRLQQHQSNMVKFTQTEQWPQLHREQVNAMGTVQQVKATLQELQRVRAQVVDNQVNDLHALLQEFREQVVSALGSFLHFCQGKKLEYDDGTSESVAPTTIHAPAGAQVQTPPSVCVPDNTCAAASREQLRQEMEELHTMALQFVCTISVTETEARETKQTVASDVVHTNSAEEKKTRSKTDKLKMAVLPVMGAILGGAVAGPVGLVTGIKIGTLAGSVGGGVAVLAGGTILSSQSKTSADVCGSDQNDNATELFYNSAPPPSPTQPPPITQHSSSAPPQHSPSSVSSLSSLQSDPQTVTTQSRGVDNRRQQPCADGSDDNGNMTFWDQILLWGKTPQ